jgi:hypothetical protein
MHTAFQIELINYGFNHIYPGASERFKQCIKEENIYVFFYFRVKNSNDYYKPVENDLMLVFSKWTKFEELVNVPLASMEQLQARLDSRVLFTGEEHSYGLMSVL